MSEPYLYEFLYRGRPTGDPQPPAWHVVIGQHVMPPGAAEAQFVSSGALTPAQAEAAGFPLPSILDGIAAAAIAERDAAVADAEAARRERDVALAERDALVDQIKALQSAQGPDMVLVPREPTQKMLDDAYWHAYDEDAAGVWGAMIASWVQARIAATASPAEQPETPAEPAAPATA